MHLLSAGGGLSAVRTSEKHALLSERESGRSAGDGAVCNAGSTDRLSDLSSSSGRIQSVSGPDLKRQISRLAELLPDYYDKARSAYDKQTEALHDALSTALGLYDKDYQAWLDRQSARERAAAAETKNDQWEREFAEDHDRWTAELAQEAAHWAAQQAASAASQAHSDQNTNRSYAYRMAMLALQQGLSVSDALLEAAGIDKAYAETIRRYYYNLHHQ